MRLIPTAAYIRVSTQEQKLHGISLDAQRDKLREYADQHGLNIVAWYEDEGVSGRKLIKNRPELQRMIKDAQQGAFKHIIFVKLDRFFRSVSEYHEAMKRLGETTWAATEEKYDMTTANGRAFINMKLTIAELEADQTGERIRLVNDYKVKTGQPLHGSLPWSHEIVNTPDGKRVIVNESNREHCIDVINYFLMTGTLRKTLQYAKPFHSFYDNRGLKRWLSSELLIGSYKGNANYCEPLIDVDTFNAIQSKLDHHVKLSPVNTYLFSGMIRCPECGKTLAGTYNVQTIKGKKYLYKKYRCDANSYKRGCNYHYLYSENMVERCLLEQLQTLVQESTEQITVEAGKARTDKTVLMDELDRLNYMFQKSRISINEYDKQYETLQRKITECDNEPEDISSKLETINQALNDGWQNAYALLDEGHKRAFWHKLFNYVDIKKSGREYILTGFDLA